MYRASGMYVRSYRWIFVHHAHARVPLPLLTLLRMVLKCVDPDNRVLILNFPIVLPLHNFNQISDFPPV